MATKKEKPEVSVENVLAGLMEEVLQAVEYANDEVKHTIRALVAKIKTHL